MKKYAVLDRIKSPQDVRFLGRHRLEALCSEIRSFLIDTVSKTGGHLASNLGVVELTVALHHVFSSPVDEIVWDVGHQSYVHKLLTGRRDAFGTLRQEGGLSGFPKTQESEHDAFIAGHSSTSLAVADGLARAKSLRREPGHVIAVIGDGSLTGGMAFEGLNNIARQNLDVIVILNDNNMSISKNVGSLSRYLSKLRTNRSYFRLKDLTKSAMESIPVVGGGMREFASFSKGYIKNAMYGSSFFEELGFVHMGPVDGHDLGMLCDVLERAESLHRPVFIHVETVKGKGYGFAEENPGAYHGVSRFDPLMGSETISDDCFSAVFGKCLTELAREDKRICAVTAAMKYGTGLHHFSAEFKSLGRFFDVGIAEQHAVTFCAALASRGLTPVLGVYSSFLQRAYDQLLHDCAIEPRHVVLGVDRAGLVGEDGETHHGLFDCAFLTTIPGVRIFSPSSYQELEQCLSLAVREDGGLCAVRYPRGSEPAIPADFAVAATNFYHHRAEGARTLLVTYGRLYAAVTAAARDLAEQGEAVSVLKLTRVAPIDSQALLLAAGYDRIFFAEEGIESGGIAEHFLAGLVSQGFRGQYFLRAVHDRFVPQATVARQLQMLGLDRESLCEWLLENVAERKSS